MTAIHETAYPRLKPHPTPTELEKNFMPTDDERILIEESTRAASIINKLGFMVTLKCYQCLGYAVNLKDVPEAIISYISKVVDGVEIPDISGYASSSKKRHRKIILQHLNISDIENNLQGIQKKIINFGRLAANAVILHVVANMTNVINEIKAEGYVIRPEMLNGLSPYHTGHLNRFGLFPLTGNREKLKVEFKLS